MKLSGVWERLRLSALLKALFVTLCFLFWGISGYVSIILIIGLLFVLLVIWKVGAPGYEYGKTAIVVLASVWGLIRSIHPLSYGIFYLVFQFLLFFGVFFLLFSASNSETKGKARLGGLLYRGSLALLGVSALAGSPFHPVTSFLGFAIGLFVLSSEELENTHVESSIKKLYSVSLVIIGLELVVATSLLPASFISRGLIIFVVLSLAMKILVNTLTKGIDKEYIVRQVTILVLLLLIIFLLVDWTL